MAKRGGGEFAQVVFGRVAFKEAGMMAYRLEFTLFGLPKMTNPSGAKSTHWRVIKAERDKWINSTIIATRSKRPRAPLHFAKLTLTRHSSVSPDPDGLVSGFKAVIDGLVKGGILVNDKFENIGMPNYRWKKTAPRQGRIDVLVEEILEVFAA